MTKRSKTSATMTWMKVITIGLFLGLASGFQVPSRQPHRRNLVSLALSETPTSALPGSSSNPLSPFMSKSTPRIQQRDAVIVGGGLAGLSVALFLSQMDPSRHITILDREDHHKKRGKTSVGSFAAAGMLAPQSERLPKGYLLDICMESRRMFREFCDLVETMAKESGEQGKPYLDENAGMNSDTDPWNVGYMAQGGFLAPAFAGDTVATWAPPGDSGSAMWLDSTQVRELEPNLHPDVVGGWWFPEDASVDAVRLTCSLRAACVAAGVHILSGKDYEVNSLDLGDGECKGLWLQNGKYIKAKSVLIANGSWMRTLLPVPIEPHKGQSLSLRMPPDQPPLLRRVMFAQDSYIVPKADGRIIIGATVEAGSYDPNVTPAGILHILTHALQLLPGLKDLPIEETWAGLRPTTPDKGPILGKTPWKNLLIAGGYWRNGVLLAPKTGQLLAALMSDLPLSASDQDLLDAFSWDRFTAPDSGTALAASARYAASMHPIHSRKSGAGVAAAVGTELGSYSSARAAAAERKLDRESLFGSDNNDANDAREDAFERAAALGQQDASAFVFGNVEKPTKATTDSTSSQDDVVNDDEDTPAPQTLPFDGSADAYTVGSSSDNSSSSTDLDSAYKAIQENKARQKPKLPDGEEEAKPDPGFRIFHVDPETREQTEVPPYTSPGDFLASLEKERNGKDEQQPEEEESNVTTGSTTATSTGSSVNGYSEKTYDGYQEIQEANASRDRGDELKAMRLARQKNRLGSQVDLSEVGALRMDDDDDDDNDEPMK